MAALDKAAELLGGLEGPGCGTAGTLAICLLAATGASYGLGLWFAFGLCGWAARKAACFWAGVDRRDR